MDIVRFRLQRLRPGLLSGVLEVWGRTGAWLLGRRVHYLVGGNCDEIRIEGGRVQVLRGTTLIAEGRYAPRRRRPGASQDLKWETLLQPRSRHER